jgi:hypothetical protein
MVGKSPMATAPRFNLSLLRRMAQSARSAATSASNETRPQSNTNTGNISRRKFLALTGSGSALAVVPGYLRGDGFEIVREGRAIHLLTGGHKRWTVDPCCFGARAMVSVERGSDEIQIGLRRAVFAGTEMTADLQAVLQRCGKTWFLRLRMAYGLNYEAELLPWLEGSAAGTGELAAGVLRPFQGMAIIHPFSKASFAPSWEMNATSGGEVRLQWLDKRLPMSGWWMSPAPVEQLAGGLEGRRTMFRFARAGTDWDIPLRRVAPEGWSIEHEEGLFDELCVEGLCGENGPVRSALWRGTGRSKESLHFLPGGRLLSDLAEPLRMPLLAPRLLVSLDEATPSSALVADMHEEPVWAHMRDISLQLAPDPDRVHFELVDGDPAQSGGSPQPTVAPCVLRADIPCDKDSSIQVTFNGKHPIPFNWATAVQGPEWFFSGLGLMPWEHSLALDLRKDHTISLLRPQDQFHLNFRFSNVRLHSGFGAHLKADKVGDGQPHCLPDPKTVARVTVIFPPQHVAERAFYEQLKSQPQTKTEPGSVETSRSKVGNNTSVPVPGITPVTIPAASLEPDAMNSTGESRYMGVESRVANESQLVFDLLPGQHIPLTFEGLLNWQEWTPTIANVARTSKGQFTLKDCTDAFKIDDPTDMTSPSYATAIEIPYRLILSPSELGAWAHASEPEVHGDFTELWHTRLAVRGSGDQTPNEQDAANRIVNAIWSPDFTPTGSPMQSHDGVTSELRIPFRTSLDGRDRNEIVHLTSDFNIPWNRDASDSPYKPAPVQVDKLMLSPMGGSLSSLGAWNPPRMRDDPDPSKLTPNDFLTVEQWKQQIEWSRDQYGRVVYKGYLLPFGHRASLVKVTERVFRDVDVNGNPVHASVLRQYFYLVMQHPRRDYPFLGQVYGGLKLPFKRIDLVTASTPAIDDPGDQTLFWPCVGGAVFLLEFDLYDWENNIARAKAAVLFVDCGRAQTTAGAQGALDQYASAHGQDPSVLTSQFNGQKIAFGKPNKPGDTTYNVQSMTWAASSLLADPNKLYRADLPYFGPEMASAVIAPSTVSRISGTDPTGPASQTGVGYYLNYLNFGFDPQKNRGEVILQVANKPLPLAFGGANKNVDKSGGLLSPDSLVVGYSRSTGPVGGKGSDVTRSTHTTSSSLDVHASGNFDPANFFGGLTSAKILGAVKLSDVIGCFAQGVGSGIDKIPQMLETALGSVDQVAYDVETAFINDIFEPMQTQVETVPALQKRLGTSAAAVRSTWQLAQSAHDVSSGTEGGDQILAQIKEAEVHAQFLGAVKTYADTVTKIVQDPVGVAEEAALDALLSYFNSLNPNPVTDFKNALYSGYDTFVAALITGADDAISGAVTALNRLARDLATQVPDPFPDADPDTVKRVLYRDLIPDLQTCLDALPIAQDLATRVQALAVSKKTGAARVEDVLGSLGPIASDLLHLEEKFGFVGLVTAQKDAVKAAVNAQQTIITNLQTTFQALDFTTLANNATAVADACAVLAESPTVGDGKSLVQGARQLQRSVQKLGNCTAALAAATDLKKAWRCALLERQVLRQCLEALKALRTTANNSVATPDATAAKAVIAACLVIEQQMPVAGWLIPLRSACLKPIASLTGAETLATTLGTLDKQMDTLADTWTNPASTDAEKLETSLQYLNAWQQYQGPVAAVYGWSVWELSGLAELGAYATWAAGQANAMRTGAAAVVADAKSIQTALTGLTNPGPNQSLDGTLVGSANSLTTIAGAMTDALDRVGVDGSPIANMLSDTADALTAAAQFVAEIEADIGDVGQIKQLMQLLPQLLKSLPKAVSIQLSLDWHPNIRSFEPVFRLEDGADLTVHAATIISLDPSAPATYNINATLTNFSINLLGDPSFIIITFNSVTFKSESGSKPNCDVKIKNVTFGAAMSFVQELASLLDPSEGPFIEFANGMLNAGYRFAVPTIPVGVFLLTQLKLEVSVGLPFDGDPVRCYLAISEQFNPFLLTCGIYSGGGYLLMRIGLDGVERLEGSLDFGVSAVVNVGPLKGYGEVLAGIHFAVGGGSSEVCGFVFAHGHCDIYGIISLDVKVNVDICYESDSNGGTSVVGEADFTVDIEILFFSASYTFTAQYAFAGSPRNNAADEQTRLDAERAKAKAALARGETPPPAKPRTRAVTPNYKLDVAAWEDYFDSFDPFPEEVLS